ncbi:hypothetical protein G6F65_017740 [Rhizopus arrhizus]|nr:hypothetical protein G6F65_017740 [Rhizopus arrhizus]
MDFHHVVAAAVQAVDGLVRPVGHQRGQLRVLVEEVGAVERTVVGGEGLELAVHRVGEGAGQGPIGVPAQQGVPVAAPDELDHVPARARVQRFQFVDDAAIAAHRSVQPLQVAVDDEDQVVELFTRRQGQRGDGFGFVHFAVAAEHPDLAVAGVGDAAGVQVLQEAGLVNGHQRAQAHRHRRELPELRHRARVRIRRQAAPADLAAEAVKLGFRNAAFQIGTRVDARG